MKVRLGTTQFTGGRALSTLFARLGHGHCPPRTPEHPASRPRTNALFYRQRQIMAVPKVFECIYTIYPFS